MDDSIFQPGDLLASFQIEARAENLGPLQCFQARHFNNSSTALIYVHDLRSKRPSAEAVLVFKGRAAGLRRLRVPHINALLEADVDDGLAWAACGAPQGLSLLEFVLEHGRLDAMTGAVLLRSIGQALHEARSEGIHRMLRPTAIYLGDHGTLDSVLCFGLASLFEVGPETRHFVAPEQWEGHAPPTERMDIYSAAAILWEAITGHEPGGAISQPNPLRAEQLAEPLPALKAVVPETPRALSRLLSAWTSHDEHQRPASWLDALNELDTAIEEMKRSTDAPKTSDHLSDDDSEAITLPSSSIVQIRMAPLSAGQNSKAPTAEAAETMPDLVPIEHADTIPAPPPAFALLANPSQSAQNPSAPLTETRPQSEEIEIKPAIRVNAETPTAHQADKVKKTRRSSFAALFLMGASIIAVLMFRAFERAPSVSSLRAGIGALAHLSRAQTARNPAFSPKEAAQHNNTEAPNEARKSKGSARRLQSGHDPQRAQIQADRYNPDVEIDLSMYAATPSD